MKLTGDQRSAAHSGDVHALIRAASGASKLDTRRYLADVASRWAPDWAIKYTLTRDASVLVPHVTWGQDDPLRCLARGTLLLDGRPWWEATRRAGLRWSVGVRWSVLHLWEGWAPEHAPEHFWAPRKAIIALHDWLEGRVSDVELGRARKAAAAAADAADAVAAYSAAAAAYTDVADAVAYAAAYYAADAAAYSAAVYAAYAADAARAAAVYAAARADARDSFGVAWTQYALGQGAHTPRG